MQIRNKRTVLAVALLMGISSAVHAEGEGQAWYSWESVKGKAANAWNYVSSADRRAEVKSYWDKGNKEKAILVGGAAATAAVVYYVAKKCCGKKQARKPIVVE